MGRLDRRIGAGERDHTLGYMTRVVEYARVVFIAQEATHRSSTFQSAA